MPSNPESTWAARKLLFGTRRKSRGFPTSFSSPVTFFGVWPRSPMPHLFLIANCFACDAYLFLGVYLVLQPNYDIFDKPEYDTILSSI